MVPYIHKKIDIAGARFSHNQITITNMSDTVLLKEDQMDARCADGVKASAGTIRVFGAVHVRYWPRTTTYDYFCLNCGKWSKTWRGIKRVARNEAFIHGEQHSSKCKLIKAAKVPNQLSWASAISLTREKLPVN